MMTYWVAAMADDTTDDGMAIDKFISKCNFNF